MKTENNLTAKEIEEKEFNTWTKVLCVITAVMLLICVIVVTVSIRKEEIRAEQCIYTTAVLIETKEESYQWVPRYGGRIQTGYEYIRTFEFVDNTGTPYRFKITMQDEDSSKYLEVDVRYEEESPKLFEFNIGKLRRNKDQWMYYNK